MSDSRMSSTLSGFTDDIDTLDDLANEPGIPPNATKSIDWKWTAAELLYVHTIRLRADIYWSQVKNSRVSPVELKDEYKQMITDFFAYDHGKSNSHHLLEKIGLFGTMEDCEYVKVKANTPLARTPVRTGNFKVDLIPVIELIYNQECMHMLCITNPATPKSKARPKGLLPKVYCYISDQPTKKLSDYKEVGVVNRGYFLMRFDDPNLPSDVKLFAWYYVVYENHKGIKGKESEILKVAVFLKAVV